MNVRNIILLLLLPVAGLGPMRAADDLLLPEQVFLALDPILHGAVQQSPRMVSRALDLEMAESNRISARAGLLPSLSGYIRQSESLDERADVVGRLRVTKTAYDVNIHQPLFFWGERKNNARVGVIQEQIGQGNYRAAYRGLAQELRQKYLGLIVHKLTLARMQRYLAHTRQQLALAEERRAKGVISELEIHPVRLAAEQAQISAERAEFDLENARHDFIRLAGLGGFADGQIPDDLPVITPRTEVVNRQLATFLSHDEFTNVEAVNLRNQIEIEGLNYRNQKTRLLPKLSFSAGVSQDDQSYTINIAQRFRLNSQYAGVTVSWTIFDGFSAQAGVRHALARRRQLESDYAELEDRLAQQARIQARLLEFSSRYMAISDRALVASEGNLQATQEEFRRGVGTEADVALTAIGLMDARIAACNARIDYLLRSADFLGALNRDPVQANVAEVK